MAFLVVLSRTPTGYDAIWIVILRLTKSANFLMWKTTTSIDGLIELYVKEIVQLHSVPASIVSNKNPRFTSRFWQSLRKAMGTSLGFSTDP